MKALANQRLQYDPASRSEFAVPGSTNVARRFAIVWKKGALWQTLAIV
jgi:hypothetical protein